MFHRRDLHRMHGWIFSEHGGACDLDFVTDVCSEIDARLDYLNAGRPILEPKIRESERAFCTTGGKTAGHGVWCVLISLQVGAENECARDDAGLGEAGSSHGISSIH